ncbi:MAG: isoprenyl transferase [Tissierellia bacterium]|nr:isoprenyl transferase [Tissierellia bacterium]
MYYNLSMDNKEISSSEIDFKKLPNHVAIIMDGNGRWAKRQNKIRSYGHLEGANRVVEIVRTASNLGISVLSLFAFSTENWKRPIDEVEKIMFLVIKFIENYIEELDENNVKLEVLGNLLELPPKTLMKVQYAIEKTKNNTGMVLNICLNYGSRQEILSACKQMILDYKDKSIEDIQNIKEIDFQERLFTKNNSNVDLLIRPSGELRISNFLLYQIAYAELYFSDVLWPDFDSGEFYKSIIDYQKRDRRFGGV